MNRVTEVLKGTNLIISSIQMMDWNIIEHIENGKIYKTDMYRPVLRIKL